MLVKPNHIDVVSSSGYKKVALACTSWNQLRGGLHPRINTGTFIQRGIKESMVHEQYAENTYRSHEA